MTSNEDYRLEAAENAAINKSRMAKRAISAAAATAAGVGIGYAASQYISDPEATDGAISGGGKAGHVTGNTLNPEHNPEYDPHHEPEADTDAEAAHEPWAEPAREAPAPHVPHATRAAHTHGNTATADTSDNADTAASGTDYTGDDYTGDDYTGDGDTGDTGSPLDTAGDPDVTFTGTTAVIDPETGEYIGGYDAGTVGGQTFMLMDEDGDTEADILAIDENGNGIFEDSEMLDVAGQGIAIGNSDDINIISTDELYEAISDDGTEGEMPHNDWYDDQTDISVDNPDYVNNADLGGNPAGEAGTGGLTPGDAYFPEEDETGTETVTATETVGDAAVYDTVQPDDIDGTDAGMIADDPMDFL